MFSKLLVKLIDEAIFPAVMLVVVRILSIIVVSRYFDIPVELTSEGFLYNSERTYALVNTYSLFLMALFLFLGLLYILVKAWFLHESHVTPKMTAQVYHYRAQNLIQGSFDLYTQGTIWLSYSVLITLVTGIFAFYGLAQIWVSYFSFALTVLAGYFLLVDVEQELALNKPPTKNNPENEAYVLEMKGDYA